MIYKTKGEIVVGSPAFEISGWRKSSVLFKKLPELREQVLKLIKDVESLKNKLNPSDDYHVYNVYPCI